MDTQTIISAFAFYIPFYADPKLTTSLITVHTYAVLDAISYVCTYGYIPTFLRNLCR